MMDIKLDDNLKKIIEEGDDVVIRKKKRDGKLVYIVYQQSMKIRAIIPCDQETARKPISLDMGSRAE